MSEMPRATAFHPRTAAANRLNAWTTRNGVTLPAAYRDANGEAIVARSCVAISDLGARWQVMLEGARVVEFLQRFLTRDVSRLIPGGGAKALWLADGGGVRGAAVVARFGRESFWLVSASRDDAWLARTAELFDVKLREVSTERHGLAIIGPHAAATVQAAGLPGDVEMLSFRRFSWRGGDIVLSRFGEHGGYEIWCTESDATLIWDRIARAGAAFAVEPIGVAAMEILDLEAGIPRPHLDYMPATAGDAQEPRAENLAMEALIDTDNAHLNGGARRLRDHKTRSWKLMGLELDSDCPAPHTPLSISGKTVGRTLSSRFSPALRRAIALAQISAEFANPGTAVSLVLPPSVEMPDLRLATARIADLPFLARPDSLPR